MANKIKEFFQAPNKVRDLEKRLSALDEERKKGKDSYSLSEYFYNLGVREYQNLSLKQLWETYSKSSSIRECVDRLVRSISRANLVIVKDDNATQKDIKKVNRFFYETDKVEYSFKNKLQKTARDLVVYDIGVFEKVFNITKSQVVDLDSLDASTVKLTKDSSGRILGYTQVISGKPKVEFASDEIIRLILHPNNRSSNGQPIIDSIVEETATLLLSIDEIAKCFTSGNIPEGILLLGDIGQKASERILEKIKEERTGKSRNLFVLRGTDQAKWLDFKKPFREMQLMELRESVERIIWRNFGFDPVSMGDVSSSRNQDIGESKYVTESEMVQPILEIIEDAINIELISDLNVKGISIKLARPKIYENIRDKAFAASRLVGVDLNGKQLPILTVSEARKIFLDLEPMEKTEGVENAK